MSEKNEVIKEGKAYDYDSGEYKNFGRIGIFWYIEQNPNSFIEHMNCKMKSTDQIYMGTSENLVMNCQIMTSKV